MYGGRALKGPVLEALQKGMKVLDYPKDRAKELVNGIPPDSWQGLSRWVRWESCESDKILMIDAGWLLNMDSVEGDDMRCAQNQVFDGLLGVLLMEVLLMISESWCKDAGSCSTSEDQESELLRMFSEA